MSSVRRRFAGLNACETARLVENSSHTGSPFLAGSWGSQLWLLYRWCGVRSGVLVLHGEKVGMCPDPSSRSVREQNVIMVMIRKKKMERLKREDGRKSSLVLDSRVTILHYCAYFWGRHIQHIRGLETCKNPARRCLRRLAKLRNAIHLGFQGRQKSTKTQNRSAPRMQSVFENGIMSSEIRCASC